MTPTNVVTLEPGVVVAHERNTAGHQTLPHGRGDRGFKKLAICTERRPHVIEPFIALANAVIITRRLLAEAGLTHRWAARSDRRPGPIRATC